MAKAWDRAQVAILAGEFGSWRGERSDRDLSRRPEFPEEARQANLTGDLLDSLGGPKAGDACQSAEGLGMGLDEKAVEAVK